VTAHERGKGIVVARACGGHKGLVGGLGGIISHRLAINGEKQAWQCGAGVNHASDAGS